MANVLTLYTEGLIVMRKGEETQAPAPSLDPTPGATKHPVTPKGALSVLLFAPLFYYTLTHGQ